jgi:signal transduction histidine kinase
MSPVLAVLFFAVITLSFIPVHNRLRRLIDHLVYRDRYNHVYFLRELAAQLASVAPIDEVLPAITHSIAQAMNLQGAAVLLRQSDGTLAIRAASGACADPANIVELTTRGLARQEGDACDAAEAGLWLPLVAHGEEAGLLYLGAKCTRAPMGADDLSVAQTIASNAAITVANALLVERLRTKVAELELLRDRLVHAQEAERKRIAQDLHDGALHTLLGLVRQAEGFIERSLSSTSESADGLDVTSQLRAIAERGRDAAYELRATCADLYPSELQHLGLAAALESLAETRSVSEDLEVAFTRKSFPVDCRLPEPVEDAIYRAAREAVDNVSRHARARRAAIELKLEPAAVVLSIQDDGQGFTAPMSNVALLRSGHFGLASMRERVERLGGSLDISSRRGSGARVCLRIPRQPLVEKVEARAV